MRLCCRTRAILRCVAGTALLVLGFAAVNSAGGCAALVGGAAGAGTGYIAGHEAAENHEHHHHD